MIRRAGPATLCCLATILVGCAQSPQAIHPAHVPARTYVDYDCRELQEETTALDFKLRELFLRLERAHKRDRRVVAVSFLFLPAIAMLEGKGSPDAHEYARLLGLRDAVSAALERSECAGGAEQADDP